ncbi:MAG: hypothetical protein R3B90_21370 [Planctomycetaceae bacterium]
MKRVLMLVAAVAMLGFAAPESAEAHGWNRGGVNIRYNGNNGAFRYNSYYRGNNWRPNYVNYNRGWYGGGVNYGYGGYGYGRGCGYYGW